MPLFSKPPAKKPPAPGKPAGPARPAPSARELTAEARQISPDRPQLEPIGRDTTMSGASMIEWTPQQPAIEVAQANPGLCAVLENSALLFASGQAAQARALLEQGVASDHDAKTSPLAWHALFDLLERAGDRAAFDQFSLQYVVQFERSPPAWGERGKAAQAAAPKPAPGLLALSGRLTPASATQIEGLRKAIAKKLSNARLDLSSVTSFDDEGARLLAAALGEARRSGLDLSLQKPEKLQSALDAAVNRGREGGEGAWLLSLELMQWLRDQAAFDDRAIEYAVAFEMSPPSWEPPPAPLQAVAVAADAVAASDAQPETLEFRGVIAGTASTQLHDLAQFATTRSIVPVDMTGVDRIDFVCAGAILNAIDRIESQRKAVQILGASPIIRALLLLIGISPRHFVRKSP